jgi:hypothetical protein
MDLEKTHNRMPKPTQLGVILVSEQLDAQFLLWYVYLNPLHVSSNYVLILRRTTVLIRLI